MIEENVPAAEYRLRQGLNFSSLNLFFVSPEKYHSLKSVERTETDAMKVGTALHTMALEPEKFNERYFCLPEMDRRTKAGKELYAQIEATNRDKVLLRPDDFRVVAEAATAIRTNSFANGLLSGAITELTATWHDAATNLDLKGRIDAYNEKLRIVVDIKTTTDAGRGFSKIILQRGYHRQAAFYMDALRANGRPVEHVVLIAVEKDPPYSVALYKLCDDTLRLSKAENDALLKRYAHCLKTDHWPGYTHGIATISLPNYAMENMEELYG